MATIFVLTASGESAAAEKIGAMLDTIDGVVDWRSDSKFDVRPSAVVGRSTFR
jgi:hypothetical protein